MSRRGPELVAQADDLQRRVEELEEERERFTDQLERAALAYSDASFTSVLCCTAGRLDYLGAELDSAGSGVIRFGTGCSYHGHYAGNGLAIPIEYLEPYFTSSEVRA